MTKKILTMTLCTAIMLCALFAFTSCSTANNTMVSSVTTATTVPDYTDDNGIGYNVLDDGSLKVVSSPEDESSLEIPSEYDGKTITQIGKSAFKMNDAKSVTLPDTITVIDEYAFAFSSKLEQINIPDGVTSIGTNAFSGCTNLTSITLPDSLEEIGMFAFDASGLETITIPKSVQTVGEYAFAECSSLTDVTFEGKKTEIGDNAFNTSTNVNIIASENSKAISFAKSSGIPYTVK